MREEGELCDVRDGTAKLRATQNAREMLRDGGTARGIFERSKKSLP